MGNKRQPLTNKQAELLRFLYKYRSDHGESPTLATTVNNQGLASNRSAIDMMRSLVARGYLESASKVSRSTKLTPKALVELKLLEQPKNVIHGHPPFAKPGLAVPTSAQATWVGSPPTWAVLPDQQKGTQSSSASDDIQRLLRNAASMLINAGTAPSLPVKPRVSTHPLVFFAACCVAIIVIFGAGVEGGILFAIVVLTITLRSIR